MTLENVPELVERDVREGIGEFFTGGDGFTLTGETEVGHELWDSERLACAVPWKWHGFHERTILGATELTGIAPTGAELEIHGITLVFENEDGEPRFRRYIDWLGALAPLGVGLSGRPVIHADEPADRPTTS